MKKPVLLLAFIICAIYSNAQPVKASAISALQVNTKTKARLDSLFHYLDSTGLYNGNILVGIGGKKFASASIGYANFRTKETLTAASVFELASVSKQFTAAGILHLVEAGKLKLDQNLETIFPDWPYKGMSIRNLLNHTSGLPEYEEMMKEHWVKSKIATNKDVLAMLIQLHLPVKFPQGTKWEYSNTGYAMLGSVIEKISGKSYAKFMQDSVFAPLHLDHTSIYMRRYAPRKINGYAYGYVQDDSGQYQLPDSVKDYDYVRYLDGIGGDGSVNTTEDDLLKWDNVIRDKKFLSAALWKEALTPPIIAGKSTDYGFGLGVNMSPERGLVLSHTGGWPGYTTRNVFYVDKDVVLIYLGNFELPEALTQQVWDAVKNIVFDRPFRLPVNITQVAVSIDSNLFRNNCGVYESVEMKGFELTIRQEGNHYFAMATGQGELELSPESETRFFVAGASIVLEFKPTHGKPTETMVLHQNGDHEFRRRH